MYWFEKLDHCFIDFDDADANADDNDDDDDDDDDDDANADDDDDDNEVSEECSESFLLFATNSFRLLPPACYNRHST